MEKNVPLVLDSSVFKQVPKLNSPLFKELIRYTRAEIYRIYISEIVEREFLTWIETEAREAVGAVAKATKSLSKYHMEPEIFLNPTIFFAETQSNSMLNAFIKNWNEFKKKTNAAVMPIHAAHGKLVMDAYFSGGAPFSQIKGRSDIPDAFIYFAMKDVLKNHAKLIFVSADKDFSRRIACDGIQCFGNLSELFSDGPSKLDENYYSSLNSEERDLILLNIFDDYIKIKLCWEVEISSLMEEFGKGFVDIAIGEGADVSVRAVDLKMDTNSTRKTLEMSLLIPFTGGVEFTVASVAQKEDLVALNEQRLKNIDKEVDDNGEFKIWEIHRSMVSGNFSLKFEDSDPSTWKEHGDASNFLSRPDIREISVSLEDIQLIDRQ